MDRTSSSSDSSLQGVIIIFGILFYLLTTCYLVYQTAFTNQKIPSSDEQENHSSEDKSPVCLISQAVNATKSLDRSRPTCVPKEERPEEALTSTSKWRPIRATLVTLGAKCCKFLEAWTYYGRKLNETDEELSIHPISGRLRSILRQ